MKNSLLIIFTTLLVGCSVSSKETQSIDTIDLFRTFEDNLQLSKNLLSYDYSYELVRDLGTEFLPKIDGKVSVGYFIQGNQKQIDIRVTTFNLEKEVSNQFISFYSSFLEDKKKEHFSKRESIKAAESLSEELITLINENELDSVWTHVSSRMLDFTTKNDFLNVLKRDSNFRDNKNYKLRGTRVFEELNDITGDFYVVNYDYDDGLQDEMVFEKTPSGIKLLGYTMYTPN